MVKRKFLTSYQCSKIERTQKLKWKLFYFRGAKFLWILPTVNVRRPTESAPWNPIPNFEALIANSDLSQITSFIVFPRLPHIKCRLTLLHSCPIVSLNWPYSPLFWFRFRVSFDFTSSIGFSCFIAGSDFYFNSSGNQNLLRVYLFLFSNLTRVSSYSVCFYGLDYLCL